jgi:salicylate hydroxylase
VIGCDGVKSRVRELLLGEGKPASYPHFSHKVAFRGLIPMDKAEAALGEYKAHNWHMHIGPDVHILHFPVANQALMNVVAFVTDPLDWPSDQIMTAPATKAEVVEAFASWGTSVRAITNLLPEELNKWAIFDTYDDPAPTYTRGRICIAGDAAHASSPHLGAGAGVGVEDALALATLMEMVTSTLQSTDVGNAKALSAAFDAFDAVRREHTQSFVHSSRHICETFEWANSETGSDPEKCFEEIKLRFHKIWYFDIEGMLCQVAEEYKRRLTA